jgi:DHA2 family multidrug resistance protein
MPFVGALIGRVEPRYLAAFGFAILSVSLYHMATINLDMTYAYAASLRMFQAFGLAFLFVPINTASYFGIRPDQNNDVSGLTNLARNVGGTVGTSLVTTLLARRAQAHQVLMVAHSTNYSAEFLRRTSSLTSTFTQASQPQPALEAYGSIYRQMLQQSAMLAYVDILYFFAVVAAIMVPMALLLNRRPAGAAAAMGH